MHLHSYYTSIVRLQEKKVEDDGVLSLFCSKRTVMFLFCFFGLQASYLTWVSTLHPYIYMICSMV